MNIEHTEPSIIWTSPLGDCQLCGRDFGGVMYDVLVPRPGSWGNICQRCFDDNGCHLGTGGHRYELTQLGGMKVWLKTAG